jgi:hypothetical protein
MGIPAMKAFRIVILTLLIVTIVMLISEGTDDCSAETVSGSCGDNAVWTFDQDTLTISGSGRMSDFYSELPPWENYRTRIKTIQIEEGITYIGGKSFEGMTNLTSITIANTVKSTGPWILRYCSSLESLTIPDSVESMSDDCVYECNNLKVLNLSSNMTNLGDAFWKLPALETLTIPEGVTDMGYHAFDYCISLKTVNFPESLRTVRGFNYCDSLTEVSLPHVQTLFTCFYCSNLQHIDLGDSLRTIYSNALSGAPIKYISFPNTLRDTYSIYGLHFYNSDGSQEYEQTWVNLSGKTFKGTDGKNLYEWDAENKIKVSYNVNGGSIQINDSECSAFDIIRIPSYEGVKDYYEFVGWNDGNRTIEPGAMYQLGIRNLELVAIWSLIEYDYATYDWAVDGSTCTVNIICLNNESNNHSIENVLSQQSVLTPATCTVMGTTRYSISGDYGVFHYSDTKTITDIPALGHDYHATYQWADDGSYCIVHLACANDAAHNRDIENIAIQHYVKKQPSCFEMGTTTYSVSGTYDGLAYGSTKDIHDIPALEPEIVQKNSEESVTYANTVTENQTTTVTEIFNTAKTGNSPVEVSVPTAVTETPVVIAFDSDAVNAIGGNDVTITANVIENSTAIEEAELVIEVTLQGATFSEGKAKVTIPLNESVPSGKTVDRKSVV